MRIPIKHFAAAILFFTIVFCSFLPAQGQTSTAKGKAGALLVELVKNINPSSFFSTWPAAKASFLAKAAQASDGGGLGKSISSLASFVKPSMFQQAFNLAAFKKQAGSVSGIGNAAKLLTDFEGGLKPEAMAAGWKSKRANWIEALKIFQ